MQQINSKEYKTRGDLVGKVIHWELCKKFKLDHINKWYMHNPKCVLENEAYEIPLDFQVQTDHLILARRPNLVIVTIKKRKKEKMSNRGLCRSDRWQSKNRKKQKKKKKKKERKKERNISTKKLLENLNNYGTWQWRWYQL